MLPVKKAIGRVASNPAFSVICGSFPSPIANKGSVDRNMKIKSKPDAKTSRNIILVSNAVIRMVFVFFDILCNISYCPTDDKGFIKKSIPCLIYSFYAYTHQQGLR